MRPASRRRNPDRPLRSIRQHQSRLGMAWPNRGVTVATRRPRAISRLRRATTDRRMRERTRPPTISLPIRPLPSPPPRTNHPGLTTANPANQHTYRVMGTPSHTNRQQRHRRPWQAVCRWHRTLGAEFIVRPTAQLGRRLQSLPRARRNPRRRRPVRKRVRARRRPAVPGQGRAAHLQRRSIRRWLTHRLHRSVLQRHNICRLQVKQRARGRSHRTRSQATVRETARHHRSTRHLTTRRARQPLISLIHLAPTRTPARETRTISPPIRLAPWATRRTRGRMASTN